MFSKHVRFGSSLIVMTSVCITLVTPLVSMGAGETGRDWFCSEPEKHTMDYQQHVKKHLDSGAKDIVATLEKIYNDQALTTEQKKAQTLDVLNTYLMKTKLGTGD